MYIEQEIWISYLDILGVTAVDTTTGAVLTEGTTSDVAEGDEATVAVLGADGGLVGATGLAAADAAGKSGGEDSEGDESELHCEGWGFETAVRTVSWWSWISLGRMGNASYLED